MADELEERLRGYSKAFEGLMSLIPAKDYYGQDNDDQWQRKKQTKEQKRAAKVAKLEPGAYKTALDVHKEREQKRKRELEEENEDSRAGDGDAVEQPREGLVESRKSLKKKQKLSSDAAAQSNKAKGENLNDESARKLAKAERRREKEARKQAKIARKKEKAKAKKSQKDDDFMKEEDVEAEIDKNPEHIASADNLSDSGQVEPIDFKDQSDSSRSPSLDADTPVFSNSHRPSSESSTSSINPPAEPENAKDISAPITSNRFDTKTTRDSVKPTSNTNMEDQIKENEQSGSMLNQVDGPSEKFESNSEKPPKLPKMPDINQELLRERLNARIAELRAERKADGLDGKPARNRAELIEARRRKEEARRAHKKELRNKAKEQDVEAEAARLRGSSGSPLWSSPGVFPPPKEPKNLTAANNFSFGRVAFADGTHGDASAGELVDSKKKKGPQDPKTALEAAEKKRSRLNGLDEQKRADIEEKDRWLNAKKRVHGEKVRDDTNLLRKALKNKMKGKEKSENAWKERTDGVQKSIEAKQAKRDGNLAKRKDEKAAKKAGVQKPKPKPKPKRRPGFEGTFKTVRRNV